MAEEAKEKKERIGDAEGFGSHDVKFFEKQIKKTFKGEMRSDVIDPKGAGCGSYRLDMALTEAFPMVFIHEISAKNGVGKTTLALEILGQYQSRGFMTSFFDVEGSLNKSLAASIQTLDTSEDNPLWIYKEAIVQDEDDKDDTRGMTGDECLQYVELFLSTFKNTALVVDSIDALVPESILNKKIGENTMGKLGALMSDAVRKIKTICKKNNNCLIWINQVRENPGKMFGDPEYQPGGNAVPFYACQRLKLIRNEAKANLDIDEKTGMVLGHLVKIKVLKNKLPTTNYEPFFWLKYGQGIDRARELAELAIELGIVENEKTSYYFNRGTDKEVKIVGAGKANAYIRNNPDVLKSLEKDVLELLGK